MLGAITRGTLTKAQLTWIIRDPFKLPVERESFSPQFYADKEEAGVTWMLKIKKTFCYKENKELPLGLFLNLFECTVIDPNVTARFTSTRIFDETGETLLFEKKSDSTRPMSFNKVPYGYNYLLSEHLLIRDLEKVVKIPQGLLIRFSIEYEKGILEYDTPSEKLFKSKSGSDICFIIAGQEIKAHKSILTERSPVFAAMFEAGMKEKVADRINIPAGISPDIFNELLRFIYTGRVQFTKSNAEPLLAASDQYSISSLKSKCEKFFIKQISTENCMEMLALALLHNAPDLKERTADKISRLVADHDFREKEAWKIFKFAQPYIAFDILENLLDECKKYH